MRHRAAWPVYAVLILAACASARRARHGEEGDPRDRPPVVRAFERRASEYAKLSRRARGDLARLGNHASAERIDSRVARHAENIRERRAGAVRGELFDPPIVAHIAAIVRKELKGAEGADERKAIRDDAPRGFTPVVNADYPEREPLSTVPPTLLMSLPRLPEELDYRFVGRHLLLRDVNANLIVDFIENCLPQP